MIPPSTFILITLCAFTSALPAIDRWRPAQNHVWHLKTPTSSCCSCCAQNDIQNDVRSSRLVRQTGVALGSGVLSTATMVGVASGIIDPLAIPVPTLAALVLFVVNTWKHNEYGPSLPESAFDVQESLIPNAGLGLFASTTIAKDTYLTDYGGETLSEEEYFNRYPDGQGRYVASVNEQIPFPGFGELGTPIYIDGVDPSPLQPRGLLGDRSSPSSNHLARYMNSLTVEEGANVIWRKQRYGAQAGQMHFYTLRDIHSGEEICFDYGENYWGAFVE